MIIPVRCWTCGRVVASKWRTFEKEREKLRQQQDQRDDSAEDSQSTSFFYDEPPLGNLMDAIGLDRICCRRMLMTHVDMIDII